MRKRRLVATFTVHKNGDGVIEMVAPRGLSRLLETISGAALGVFRFFAAPNYTRAPGASQIDFGIRLALMQYDRS